MADMREQTRYASRKFILASFLLLSALGLLVTGYIPAPMWQQFSTWVLALYITGNVGTYLVHRVNP